MTNVIKHIEALRDAARTKLRAIMINGIMEDQSEINRSITRIEKEIAAYTKEIAVLEFNKSEVKENDPEKDSKIKSMDEQIKNCTEHIESMNKEIEKLDKAITELDDSIANVLNGETKMSLNAINSSVSSYLDKEDLKDFVSTEEVIEEVQE